MSSTVRKTDGQTSFIGGVDSGRTPTIASQTYSEGLPRNMLAWANNATMRGGGVVSRYGWKKIATGPWKGIFQGGSMYEPPSGGFPYLVISVGGRIWRVRVDTDNSVDKINLPGNPNPDDVPQCFMCQGEQFLVIQAGDFTTLPMFWDGTTMRRSSGLSGTPRELPPAGPMDYYMGRLWYAIGRTYCAGDIVNGVAGGTAAYNYRDSILRVTENLLASGGDGFIVPSNQGNIRALHHTSNLDVALGQGPLYAFTRKAIYACQPPVTRADWTNADRDAPPIQTLAQKRFGAISGNSVCSVNGDLFYASSDGIRSLIIAKRYFGQWGNTPISRNENRAILANDRKLMRYASGIEFDNRLLQTCLPIQTSVGVAFRGIIPLDFDLISSFQKKDPPAWEGVLEGLQILQLFEGDFGGLQRAFAAVVSQVTGNIEIWELTLSDYWENGDNRITWSFETPAYTWDTMFDLKRLQGLELWIDRMFGSVDFKVYYRPDQNPCWYLWHAWKDCAAKNRCEDMDILQASCPYPDDTYCEQYRSSVALPEPHPACVGTNMLPSNFGYQFQLKIVIHGFCRICGLLIHSIPADQPPGDGIVCP